MADLKVDKEFSVAVTQARETLAEYLYEEAVLEADKATGREDTPACALRYKARIEAAQALERLRVPNKSGQGSHLHLHQGNTIYISPERREALQAQRERLLGPNESLTSGLPNERLTRGTTSVEDISSDERKIERKSATDPGTPGEGGSP